MAGIIHEFKSLHGTLIAPFRFWKRLKAAYATAVAALSIIAPRPMRRKRYFARFNSIYVGAPFNDVHDKSQLESEFSYWLRIDRDEFSEHRFLLDVSISSELLLVISFASFFLIDFFRGFVFSLLSTRRLFKIVFCRRVEEKLVYGKCC